MSLFDSFRNNQKMVSHMRREKQRIDSLDWQGLEKHLKEYHEYFLHRV